MSDAPKLPPISQENWPEEAMHLRDDFAGKLNVYRVMAHHPALLSAWADLRQHVVKDTSLGPAFSEVVILRTGHRLGAAYEWVHHVSRARALGFDEARIASIKGDAGEMAADDSVLTGAVDELFDAKRLSAQTQAAVVALVGVEGMMDLIATVGFYSTLGYILQSFDTPLEDWIKAELAAKPAP